MWDAADQMVFRPLASLWTFAQAAEAWNANALDEVPSSSWFEDRSGPSALSPAEVGRGPCVGDLEDGLELHLISGKPDGDNPGFVARANDGRRFVVKLDSMGHPRATTADVVVSKLYHAVGYRVPCNRIVALSPERLSFEPGASYQLPTGERRPMTRAWLDRIFSSAERFADGRVRASASEFLEGEPLGPFRYSGIRDDDPNDVVPHEERRELRASRVVAAWAGHTDSREANTLDTWLRDGPKDRGHVEHHLLDFGDSLGSVWEPPTLGRRVGTSAYFDVPDILADWLSFGALARPWETRRFGPLGKVLGYFDVEHFEPARWTPGYDNPAMLRMTARDAAFMARRIARVGAEHVAAAVDRARLEDPVLERELRRILEGRRRRILDRYLLSHSALAWPTVAVERASPRPRLVVCLEDLAVASGAFSEHEFRYRVASSWTQEAPPLRGREPQNPARICAEVPLPDEERHAGPPSRSMTWEASVRPPSRLSAIRSTVRLHLWRSSPSGVTVVGLERLEAQSD